MAAFKTRHIEYKHELANILRSRYVARTPSVEARSAGRRSNVENAPSPASHRPAARAHPAERSHYVVISRDGLKLVTRVRVMLPQQRNPCTDCKSAQLCTTRGSLYHAPNSKLHPGSCGRTAADRHIHTDRPTDARDHNTFCVVYDSLKM